MQKERLRAFGGPPGARLSTRESHHQKNDSRTRRLKTNPQMPKSDLWINSKHQRLRDMHDHSKKEEVTRAANGFNAGHDKAGQSIEFLSLEKLSGLPTLAAVAITNGNPVWAKKKKKNNKNGQILIRDPEREQTHKQPPLAKSLPTVLPKPQLAAVTLAD